MGRPKKIIVNQLLSDEETAKLQGCWIDESYIKLPVIRENVDVYYKDENGCEKLLLKLVCEKFFSKLSKLDTSAPLQEYID